MARGTMRQVLDAFFQNPGSDPKYKSAGETHWFVRPDGARVLGRDKIIWTIFPGERAFRNDGYIPRFTGTSAYLEARAEWLRRNSPEYGLTALTHYGMKFDSGFTELLCTANAYYGTPPKWARVWGDAHDQP